MKKPVIWLIAIGLGVLTHSPALSKAFYDLEVKVFPAEHRIVGKGTIISGMAQFGYIVPGTLEVKELSDRPVPDGGGKSGTGTGGVANRRKEFSFQGRYSSDVRADGIRNPGVMSGNYIGVDGFVLTSGWFPLYSEPVEVRLRVSVPRGWTVVTIGGEGKSVENRDGTGIFHFSLDRVLDSFPLVGGKYNVSAERIRGVTVKTYFSRDNADLTVKYRKKVRELIDFYEPLLGKYPYSVFSVVENILPTGYSFPTLTLIGSSLMRMDYLLEISLGHELAHQWFGHYVSVEPGRGNWSEGLATYIADHMSRELKGEGSSYRKKMIIDYLNYVRYANKGGEVSLTKFRNRIDFKTKAVGYGKAAMVFHMVRKTLGDEKFFRALKAFIKHFGSSRAGWDDLEESFSQEYGRGMRSFFRPWVEGKGLPEIGIPFTETTRSKDGYRLAFDLHIKGGAFTFDLPITVRTEDETLKYSLHVDGDMVRFEHLFRSRPVSLVIDEDYDVFRVLTDEEYPPVMSGFSGNRESALVLPSESFVGSDEIAKFFNAQGFKVIKEEEISPEDMRSRSLFFLTRKSARKAGFTLKEMVHIGDVYFSVFRNPFNSRRVVVLAGGENPSTIGGYLRRIFRYGNYSRLEFKEGKNIFKKIAPALNGMVVELRG